MSPVHRHAHLKTKPAKLGHRTVYHVEAFKGSCAMCAAFWLEGTRSACHLIRCSEEKINGRDSIVIYKEDMDAYVTNMAAFKLGASTVDEVHTYRTPVPDPRPKAKEKKEFNKKGDEIIEDMLAANGVKKP